ncbi:YciI family protein [Tengunoibacter tsumagoiensis]|uniref:YCII-related domain-containing protein n=1 Tax=Tengunoibacter tsumagoiensis TaxID=2014871 RepID=A0A402AAB2_9CHLR|nr:YciI family protein [Tengunoibacter tsumagoiensis]GCE16038.1 hypothetical protein KTT_58970 [Tengunoibacter tsumagoiensis]
MFDIPENMIVYYLRLLKRGPNWTPEETPELEQLQSAHLAYGQKLRAEGKLIINGPLIDNGYLRGCGIFRTASLEEAQALSDADPAVQAGRLVSEVHPWMTFKGIFPD